MSKKRSSEQGKSWYQYVVLEFLIPLVLIVTTPLFLLVYVHFAVECRSRLEYATGGRGFVRYVQKVISDVNFKDAQCWLVLTAFAAWTAFVPLIIGGKKIFGPATVIGYRPQYVDSAFRFYLLSTALLAGILVWPVGWTWYLKLLPLTCTTCVFGFVFTVLLFVKGIVCPSPGEHGTSGNLLFDFYWGRELYPRIGQFLYLKEWAVAFYGMMGWFAVTLVCWKAQYENIGWNWAMGTSCITLVLYMAKFYWWYQGYLHCLDIVYDRAGFYLGWGGVGLMPTFMACHAIYMVENPSHCGPITCFVLTASGICFACLTYVADMQKLEFRRAKGKCTVWGKPAKVIKATFKDGNGRDRSSYILTSGFWGTVRHPNYIFEFLANLFFVFPAGFDSFVPYLWVLFLLVIFVHRIFRDDSKCRKKYGRFWDDYCGQVPYVLIPGVY